MQPRLLTGIIIFILLTTSVSALNMGQTQTTPHGGNHEPIYINGNDDFTPENGVTGGSGTENDPYIISDWIIDGDGVTDNGIFINNTNVYFTIINCTVSKFHNSYTGGINFENVVNGCISKSTAYNNEAGIRIKDSSLIQIDNTSCYGNTVNWYSYGLLCRDSQYITIVDCNISNNNEGIYLIDSSTSKIRHSLVYGHEETGVTLSGGNSKYNVVESCNISFNKITGIYVFNEDQRNIPTYNTISNCYFFGNGMVEFNNLQPAILFWFSSYNNIENCTLDANGFGVVFTGSRNNIIRNCTIKNNDDSTGWITNGIVISGYFVPWQLSRDNRIIHCDIVNNEAGALLDRSFNTIFEKNNIINNTYYAVTIWDFATCTVRNNNIVLNGYDDNDSVSFRAELFTYSDVRHNWWGTVDGPNVLAFNDQPKIWHRFSIVRYRPWLTEPVPDAGRQT